MRLPTQILLLGAILTNGARASEPTPPASAGASSNPSAAVAPVVKLEPVLVTADLWETPLERIAASVSVYDQATFGQNGVRHFGDLASQVPNLTFTGGTSRPRYFQIRGIGENSQYEGETPDSSVRFLVDDLDFTGLGTVGGTFDVRQVEVLRGPQAGAFGANAAGGVIQLVSNAPTPYYTGQVQGSVGGDNLREAGVAVGGPVFKDAPEKLMFRVAIQQHQSDGFRKNVTLGDTNAQDELSARLALTWNPSRVWRWEGTLFFADVDNGFDEFALDNNGRRTRSDTPGQDTQQSLAGSLRGTYTASPDVVFSTVTAVTRSDSIYSYDADWTAWRDTPAFGGVDGYYGFEDIRRRRATGSQEVRLDSAPEAETGGGIARWTIGAFFSRTDEDTRYFSDFAENAIYGPYGEQTRMNADYRADNESLFGQAAHDFSSATRVIVGLRGEAVQQSGGLAGTTTDSFGGVGTQAFAPEYDAVLFGGKLTLEHDLTATQLVYVSAARGYRGGGINLDRKIRVGTDPLTFEAETLWNYEAGLRGRWLEQKLTGTLAAFYTDRHDTQIRNSIGAGNKYRYFTDNADGASIYGLEASAEYTLATAWQLYGSFALMHSELDAFTYSNGAAGTAGTLPNTPKYGYTAGLRYQPATGVFGGLEMVARGDYLESLGHGEKRSAYDVVNASLGYAWDRWRVSFWARNLFDEGYEKRVFFFANTPAAYYASPEIASRYTSRADPRQLGVSAGYRF